MWGSGCENLRLLDWGEYFDINAELLARVLHVFYVPEDDITQDATTIELGLRGDVVNVKLLLKTELFAMFARSSGAKGLMGE